MRIISNILKFREILIKISAKPVDSELKKVNILWFTKNQQYLQRIKDLENLALAYQGVEKAYAIQAGRELRVIVEAEKVTDGESDKLSFEIAQKIQTEMTYPGQIKVTVIREKRAVNVAR